MADIIVGIFDPEIIVYAVVHEYGEKGRDFMRVAIDSNISQLGDFVEKQYHDVLFKKLDINVARNNIGKFVVGLIKEMILAKGLIKTGNMYRSVDFKVNNV